MTIKSNGDSALPNDCPLFDPYGRETVLIIYAILVASIPNLMRDTEYRSDQLVGSELWENSSPEDHKCFGKIIGHLVRLKYVPLVKVGRNASNMALYSLL